VTLTWDARGADEAATAYELQWRARGSRARGGHPARRHVGEWATSTQLILGTTCRKKNLAPQTCYEFRVRAASACGWSGYADALLVVTLPAADDAAAERARVAERGRQQAATKEAQKQMAEAATGRSSGSGSSGSSSSSSGSNSSGSSSSSSSSSSSNSSSSGEATATAAGREPRPPPRDVQAAGPAATGWQCVVCKRPNERAHGQCRTCFTKRSYIANKVTRASVR
jgi:hypothetical protein